MANDAAVREFLARRLPGRKLEDEEDIFASGAVNSLLAMQLLLLIEREFGICVEGEDLEMDNFRSIAAIMRFVARKSAPVEAA